MMLISIGLGLAVALLLIAGVSLLTSSHASTTGTPTTLATSNLVGKEVRGFHASDLTGTTVSAPYASGHPTVLIFFASWCGPCQHEMPEVGKYLDAHSTGPVTVMGVDVNDSNGAASAFLAKNKVRIPVATDPNFDITSGIFNFGEIPETVFISAKGVVEQVYFGAIPPKKLASGIHKLATSRS